MSPSATATHIALSALSAFEASHGRALAPGDESGLAGLEESFKTLVGEGVDISEAEEDIRVILGEM